MTATALDIVEALDFEPEVPCESLQKCPHAADKYALTHCVTVALCAGCVRETAEWVAEVAAAGGEFRCLNCDAKHLGPTETFRVLGPVHGGAR